MKHMRFPPIHEGGMHTGLAGKWHCGGEEHDDQVLMQTTYV